MQLIHFSESIENGRAVNSFPGVAYKITEKSGGVKLYCINNHQLRMVLVWDGPVVSSASLSSPNRQTKGVLERQIIYSYGALVLKRIGSFFR